MTVTNTGSTPCTANGYPTMALFSGSGAPLTVTMVNGLSVDVSAAANAAPSTVTLAPSGTAQFAYQFSDVPVGSETSCPTSESASVTMPGSTASSASFALAARPVRQRDHPGVADLRGPDTRARACRGHVTRP